MLAVGSSRTAPTLRPPRAALPGLVQRFVDRNLPAGQSSRSPVRFTQVGEMQLKPGRWLSFRAEQEMAVDRVEFVWRANFRAAPLVSIKVRDWYHADLGGLEGRLWGVFPIVRASGAAVGRAAAMRYLAELAWAPQALVLNSALEWRDVDQSTVEVATLVGRERVAVLLRFDSAGDIVAASAEARPRVVGKRVIDTPWSGAFGNYREFDGVRLPSSAEVWWLLPNGPFTYFRGTVTAWSANSSADPGEQRGPRR
jgi:uncharacterized protein DUF6544